MIRMMMEIDQYYFLKKYKYDFIMIKIFLSYIKAHNLQNPENKKKIKPDKTLCGLLNIKSDSDDLTYFSMQKYLKDHFPKDDTTVVV